MDFHKWNYATFSFWLYHAFRFVSPFFFSVYFIALQYFGAFVRVCIIFLFRVCVFFLLCLLQFFLSGVLCIWLSIWAVLLFCIKMLDIKICSLYSYSIYSFHRKKKCWNFCACFFIISFYFVLCMRSHF